MMAMMNRWKHTVSIFQEKKTGFVSPILSPIRLVLNCQRTEGAGRRHVYRMSEDSNLKRPLVFLRPLVFSRTDISVSVTEFDADFRT